MLGIGGLVITGVFNLISKKRFERTYSHDKWIFDPKGLSPPELIIPESKHNMGADIEVNLVQEQLTVRIDPDSGDVKVVRDNLNMNMPYRDLTVIIKEKSN